mmetsp:Transcript_52806/g.140391  ORF Transcript_52806/g.140391 Transcript_52806/m.140391 type:complete len:272 (+) Transcript_52806:1740-2555(+)
MESFKFHRHFVRCCPPGYAEEDEDWTESWYILSLGCPHAAEHVHPYLKARSASGEPHMLWWFKTCTDQEYNSYTFAHARRAFEVELMFVSLLWDVIRTLPVDPTRIFFCGESMGGYACLRAAELVPNVPAQVIPMSSYYPTMEGHNLDRLLETLADIPIDCIHCERDKVCPRSDPSVGHLLDALSRRGSVRWAPAQLSKGSDGGFHRADLLLWADARHEYFTKLSHQCRAQAGPPEDVRGQCLAHLQQQAVVIDSERYRSRGWPMHNGSQH